jgi:aminopeptidase N
MFLAALFERAQAGNMALRDYADLALALAHREENLRVLEQITASLAETLALMQRLRPETGAALADLLPRVEQAALDRARAADSGDAAYFWLDLYLKVAASPRGLATARDLLDGKAEIPGIDLSPEIRWRLLFRLSAGGADVAHLLAAERARDPSDFGARGLLSARAAAPSGPVKADWLAQLQDPSSALSLSRQRAVMAGLFPASQTGLQLTLLDDILGPLPALSRSRDSYFIQSYAETLLAPMCHPESVAAMQAAVTRLGDRPDPTALRFLREALQADGECLALRGAQR